MIRIQKYSIAILIIVALTLGTAVVALPEGDTYPVPPEGWWKSLKVGDTAVFETVWAWEEETPRLSKWKHITTIEKVEGSNITISVQEFRDEKKWSKKIHTTDAESHYYNEGRTSAYQILTKLNDTIFEAAGQRYNCTIYDIEHKQAPMNKYKYWFSPQIPPIYNNGLVKIIVESPLRNTRMETTLKSYNGSLL